MKGERDQMAWKRKILPVFLALSLLLSLVGGAYAELGQPAQEAAFARMNALKLANGIVRADGTVDPALGEELTRAQMVTILVRAFGKEADAKLLQGISLFPDVPGSHWASGYITTAKRLADEKGVEIGRPGGLFDPDAKVTAAEVLAFIMKFLGVPRDTAQQWPNDYIQAARTAGMITQADQTLLTGVASSNATRGLAFALADSIFYGYQGLPGGKSVYTAYADQTPPQIRLSSTVPTSTEAESLAIAGTVDADVVSLTLEGRKLTISANGGFSTTASLALGTNSFKLEAVDRAGNKGETSLTVARTAPAPVGPLVKEIRAEKLIAATFEKIQLTAIADDGKPITEGVTWTANSDNVIISPSGVFQSPVAGRYIVTAKVGKFSTFINIGVYGSIAKLKIEAPTIIANGLSRQAVKVSALDQNYLVVESFDKELSLAGTGLSVFDETGLPATKVAAKKGVATFLVSADSWLAGDTIRVTAEYQNGDDTISETASLETSIPIAASLKAEGPAFIASNTGMTTAEGAIKVWVVDQEGAPVNDSYAVDAQISGPAALVNTSSSYFDSESPATFQIHNWNHVGLTGTITLTFTVEGLGSTQLQIKQLVAGSPSQLAVKPEKATYKATELMEFTVTVSDSKGVPVPLSTSSATEYTVTLPNDLADKFRVVEEKLEIAANESSATFTLEATGPFTGNLPVTVTAGNKTGSASVTVIAGNPAARAFDREKALVPMASPQATFYGFVSDSLKNPIAAAGISMKAYVQEVSSTGETSGTDTTRVTINGKTTSHTRPLTLVTNAEGKVELQVVAIPQINKTYMIKLTDADGGDAAYAYLMIVATVPGELEVTAWKEVSEGSFISTSTLQAGQEFYVRARVKDNYGGPVNGIEQDLAITSPKVFANDRQVLVESSTFQFLPWDFWTRQFPDVASALGLVEGDYVTIVHAGKSGIQTVQVAYDLTVDSVTGSKRIDIRPGEFTGLLVDDGREIRLKAGSVTGGHTIKLVDHFDNLATTTMSQEITWTVTNSTGQTVYDKVGIRTSAAGGNVDHLTTRSVVSFYLDVSTKGTYEVTFTAAGYNETVTVVVE